MIDYYPPFSNNFLINKKMGPKIKHLVIRKTSKIIYSSGWTAKSAIEDYGCNTEKIHAVPFGTNLDIIPSKEEVISQRERYSLGDIYKLFL